MQPDILLSSCVHWQDKKMVNLKMDAKFALQCQIKTRLTLLKISGRV